MPVSRKYSRNSFKKSTQKKSKYSRNKKVSANSRKARLVGGRRVKGKRVKGKKTRKQRGGMNLDKLRRIADLKKTKPKVCSVNHETDSDSETNQTSATLTK